MYCMCGCIIFDYNTEFTLLSLFFLLAVDSKFLCMKLHKPEPTTSSGLFHQRKCVSATDSRCRCFDTECNNVFSVLILGFTVCTKALQDLLCVLLAEN